MYYNNPHKNTIRTLEDVKINDIKNGEALVFEDGKFVNKKVETDVVDSHEHLNKDVLDKISVDENGNPLFDGLSLKGENGQDGKDGINGVDGTNGADGQDGIDGAQGPQGLPGEKGEQGEKGEAGEIGPQGPKGEDGVTQDISHLATKEELDSAINGIVIPDVDLTDYYTKAETYNKEEVNTLIADIDSSSSCNIQSLPSFDGIGGTL